jgi:predicted N-acetyltransferase YhbS
VYHLEKEKPEDWWEVEALYDLCFAPGRTALSSYRLREDVAPVMSLSRTARDETGALGGALRYWPVRVSGKRVLLLGPIAVHPTTQGEGLASAMIRDSLAGAADEGWKRVLLVGDLPYYTRFGFERCEGIEMPPPTNPERILVLSLVPDAWRGLTGVVEKDA